MNIFPGAYPAFLTRNYLNRHAEKAGDLIVSSGSETQKRLFDMDPLSRWQSVGSSDLVTETIEFGLWMPGARASHDVSVVLFQNHNVKGLTLEHSDTNGAPWTTGFASAALAEKNTRAVLVTTAMDRIKVSMTTTQTANEEKKIGDIIVAGAAFQPGPFFEYKPEAPRVTQKTAKMADGSLRGQNIGRSAGSSHFWAAKCSWILDPADYGTAELFDAALATFQDFGLQGRQFVFLPAPGDRPGEARLCRVRPGTYNDPYIKASEFADGMLAVQMVIEEVGGA
ncbi:MAG: hypothetical protein PHS14_02920 [Elusimicrobia bacterium]|nr:hypothetical protein [Elusimicrobiota bacterium]